MEEEVIRYGVAHRDEDGEDFHGIPYLSGYATESLEEARERKRKLVLEGKKYIYIFKITGKKWDNTWDYVSNNKVE